MDTSQRNTTGTVQCVALPINILTYRSFAFQHYSAVAPCLYRAQSLCQKLAWQLSRCPSVYLSWVGEINATGLYRQSYSFSDVFPKMLDTQASRRMRPPSFRCGGVRIEAWRRLRMIDLSRVLKSVFCGMCTSYDSYTVSSAMPHMISVN